MLEKSLHYSAQTFFKHTLGGLEMNNNNNNTLHIELITASDIDKNALKNMHQLYLHDLSEYTDSLDINADGIFETDDIDTYYEMDSLFPILIECNKNIVGFVLLNTPPYAPKGYDYYINDFFILRKFRGQGIGKATAKKLFQTYSGKFAMVQLARNHTAINFWKRVLNENTIEYEEKEKIEDGEPCIFQGFQV